MISALNVDRLRLDMGEYVLSVQNLVKRIGARRVLDGADLDVKRGACAALIGPAGAGKSVLLDCIAGAVKPTAGRVRYFGYEIRGRDQARIARMGIVRTTPRAQPFGDMTVLQTVTVGALLRLPRLARAQARARETLAFVGLSERAGARFTDLDALDRKLLDVARALATDPQIVLLDDPAAGLSAADAVRLGTSLAAVRERGITIVAAARTLDECPVRVDDVVAIDRGKTARENRLVPAT